MPKFDTLIGCESKIKREKMQANNVSEYVKCSNLKPFQRLLCVSLCACALRICEYIFKWSSNRWQQNWKETIIYAMVWLCVYMCVCARVHIFQLKARSVSHSLFFFLGLKADIDFCLWYALITSNKSTFCARASSITYTSCVCVCCVTSHTCDYAHSQT